MRHLDNTEDEHAYNACRAHDRALAWQHPEHGVGGVCHTDRIRRELSTQAATVDKLRSLGVQSLVFDPCGNAPDQGDFLSVMQQNVVNLQQAFHFQ